MSFSTLMPCRRRRSPSTWTPPTTRCTGTRKGSSSTAITTTTAICRFTCSAADICWHRNCARPTSMAAPAASRRWRGSSPGSAPAELSQQTGKSARRFQDFTWQTRGSWSRQRRVVAKAEWLPGVTPGTGEANPRFVVTSLSREEHEARHLYEKLYCARGEMENRIKECQLDLYADRTSAQTMRANQLRLWFASMAYVLICALRRIGLAHTQFARASCGTIRLKLLKIGALVRTSVRRIKLAMPTAFPYQAEYRAAHAALSAAATA